MMKIVFNKLYESDTLKQETWCRNTKGDLIVDNYEFKATLKYVGFSRGRSALNIEWLDESTNRIYVSGMKLLDDELKLGLVNGNVIAGTFTWKKQGTSILLKKYVKQL